MKFTEQGKQALVWLAQGEDVEWRDGSEWCGVADGNSLRLFDGPGFEFRIKPKTITRTITVPEPLRVAPEFGDVVWIAYPHCPGFMDDMDWSGCSESELLMLERGLLYATESDAIAAAKAMVGVTE